MATEAYTTEEVKLRDGTEVELRPLVVAKQRKFMRQWGGFMKMVEDQRELAPDAEEKKTPDEMNDTQFDVFIDLCVLCLEEDLRGEKTAKAFREYLENTLEEPTIYRILDLCGGLNLRRLMNLQESLDQDGTI